MKMDDRFVIDDLAAQAGGYFAFPTKEDIAYTSLFFDVCEQLGIRYCSATEEERLLVDEVTRDTWARQQEEKAGVR